MEQEIKRGAASWQQTMGEEEIHLECSECGKCNWWSSCVKMGESNQTRVKVKISETVTLIIRGEMRKGQQ